MTRTDRTILSATFLFAIVYLAVMPSLMARFFLHAGPIAPLEPPREEPLQVEPSAPIAPPPLATPVPKARPKISHRQPKRPPRGEPDKVRLDCGGDPLCGIDVD